MRHVWFVLLAGCGRIYFDATTDPVDADAPRVDAGPIPATGCWDSWLAGTPQVTAPTRVTGLGALETQDEIDPSLSADGLELYHARAMPDFNLHVSVRPSRDAAWGTATAISELSSTDDELRMSVTADGLEAVVSTNRVGSMGVDLWTTQRFMPSGGWTALNLFYVDQLNSAGSDHNPELMANGLRVYWSVDAAGIYVGSRSSRSDAFSTRTALQGLDIGDSLRDPTLSPDERVIVYALGPTGCSPSTSCIELYFATRPDRDAPFGTPRPVPNVDTPQFSEFDPELSHDGCELYFTSAVSGQSHIYVAHVR